MDMKSMVLLAVAQTAKGTAGTPVPGTHAILCKGLVPTPIKGQFVERNLITGSEGNQGGIFTGEHRQFEFEVELAGSGAAGTAPKYGPLLTGCAMNETITVSTSVVYQPVKGVGKYMTLAIFLEGVQFLMTDALGTVRFELNAAQIPVMKFTFIGKYSAPTDAGVPAGVVFTGFQKPLVVGDTNTDVFTLGGLNLVVESFGLDLANQVAWRELIGDSGARKTDRKATASAVFEMTDVATRNWAESVRTGAEMALAITHGLTAGNIVQLACPKLEFNAEPSISDGQGTAMLNGSFAVKPNTGNDEVVLTIR